MYPLHDHGQQRAQRPLQTKTTTCAPPSQTQNEGAMSPAGTAAAELCGSGGRPEESPGTAKGSVAGKAASEPESRARSGVNRTTTPPTLPSLDLSQVATCSATSLEPALEAGRWHASADSCPQHKGVTNTELWWQQSKHLSNANTNSESTMVRRRYRSRSRSHGEKDDWWQDVASQVEAEKRRPVPASGLEHPEGSNGPRSSMNAIGDPACSSANSLASRMSHIPLSPQSGGRASAPTENAIGTRPRAGSLGWMNPFRGRSPLRTQAAAATTETSPQTRALSAQAEHSPNPPSVSPRDMPALVHHLTESISFVREYMGVSGRRPAANLTLLQQHGITHIVNASGLNVPSLFENHFRYLHLCIQDRDQRFCMEEMMQLFYPVCDFIDSARRAGGRVLVHCHQGVSRSSALALAYLLIRDNVWPLEEAVRQLLRVRLTACPNPSFLDALSEIELRILIGRYRMALRNAMLGQTRTTHQALWSSRSAPVPAASTDAKDYPVVNESSMNEFASSSKTATVKATAELRTAEDHAQATVMHGSGKPSSVRTSLSPMRCVTLFFSSRLSNVFSAWNLGDSMESTPDESTQQLTQTPLLRSDEIEELLKLRLFRIEKHRGTGSAHGHRGMRYLLLLRSLRSAHSAGREADSTPETPASATANIEESAEKSVADSNPRPKPAGCQAFYTGHLQRRVRVASDRCYVLHTPFSMAFLARLTDSIAQRDLAQRPRATGTEFAHAVRHRRSVSIGTQSMQYDAPSHPLGMTRSEENERLGDTRLFIWYGSLASTELLYASLRLAWNIAITECVYIESFEEKLAIRDALEREFEATLKVQQATNHFEMLTLHSIPNQPLQIVFENHEPEEFTVHLHRSRSVLSRWFAFGP
ncbi:hypothetical protein F1559_000202 [Cyanidiococcus yangmingshanensis]|uniref:Uncharacterized protein n=1 Tax=Cyanidiococcus yangmingshanensis TaxID=2690220 RepID=A0A7J7IK06_9RHOD|nr:hypothetical protein F1559_000202 [Cyanidiococcus yangmingshanensis]